MRHSITLPVTLPSGRVRVVRRLLSWAGDNTKLSKSDKAGAGYTSVGLSLAPHRLSGYNVCRFATAGCAAGCVNTSGMAQVFPSIIEARIAKTIALFKHHDEFLARLEWEIGLALRRAEAQQLRLAVRLNVFSDLPWEQIRPDLFRRYRRVRFYDYTKDLERALNPARPRNYHLTFSRSESNEADCRAVLRAGGNVAVVFDRESEGDLPRRWHGYPVFNGDQNDLRFLDPRGVVIGLYAKGRGRHDTTGFVVRTRVTHTHNGRVPIRTPLPLLAA